LTARHGLERQFWRVIPTQPHLIANIFNNATRACAGGDSMAQLKLRARETWRSARTLFELLRPWLRTKFDAKLTVLIKCNRTVEVPIRDPVR
jgi:hypothetical protein